jgi:hypothetical protein
MSVRIDYRKVSSEAIRGMAGLERFVLASGLEPPLVELVRLRATKRRVRTLVLHVRIGLVTSPASTSTCGSSRGWLPGAAIVLDCVAARGANDSAHRGETGRRRCLAVPRR